MLPMPENWGNNAITLYTVKFIQYIKKDHESISYGVYWSIQLMALAEFSFGWIGLEKNIKTNETLGFG